MMRPGAVGTYLGDGVYLDWDGNDFKLSTDREGVEHFIHLDGYAIHYLEEFISHMRSAHGAPPKG